MTYGVAAAGLIAWGAFTRLEGRERLPWLLIAASQLIFSLGDG